MSRTLKDQPGARQARRDRRFADREIPLPARPARPEAVPADPWGSFADPGLSRASRLAAAQFLGLAGLPTDAELAAAPCPHGDCRHDAGILALAVDDPDPDECDGPGQHYQDLADVDWRMALTAFANGW
jgi:hypothetical protein